MMSITRILVVILLCLSQTGLHAQNYLQATLTDATVYTQGAMLKHTATIAAERGAQVVQLAGVSSNIDQNSILVSLPPQSHLVSVSTKVVNSEKKNMTYSEQALVDSFESLVEREQDLRNIVETESFAVDMIKKNDQLFSSKENSTDDVIKAYTEYKKLLESSHKKIQKAQKEITIVNNQVKLLKAEITDKGIWTTNKTILELALQNDQSGTLPISLSYYTPSSRWTPSYRISNTDASPNVNIEYKASVYQNTGFDWKNINLSISTGNPQVSNKQPIISAWYLRYYQPRDNQYTTYSNTGRRNMSKEVAEISQDAASNVPDALPVQTQDLLTTTVFDISTPYDVKSGNQAVQAHLKNYTIPATIYFYAVPRMDKEVYMLASFTMTQATELLPGEALIINSGDYVGKTVLDPYALSDTLRLSLGRSPSVQVKRDILTSSCKTSTIGSKTTTTKFYKYDIYNALSRDIRLVIKDNVPIATDNTMDVTVKELSGGTLAEDSKIVTWDYDLKPRAKKSFEFGYEVKHPKGKSIPGL